jgi:hypothetical protein
MSILDRVKAHADSKKVRTLEVPEWGEEGAPLVIHYTMVTLAELAQVRSISPDPARQSAEIVCMKACNADGTPMFKRIDVLELMENAAPEVVLRIADAMAHRKSVDEAKNS